MRTEEHLSLNPVIYRRKMAFSRGVMNGSIEGSQKKPGRGFLCQASGLGQRLAFMMQPKIMGTGFESAVGLPLAQVLSPC
jgi:hypothetical protein